MANPNIMVATAMYGKYVGANLATTSATVILTNNNNSGVLLKIVSVTAANKSILNATVTLAIETPAVSPTAAYAIQNIVGVPARASLILISKDVPIYLPENSRLTATAGTANTIDIICSYEEIS
jgi:hypothetical protein